MGVIRGTLNTIYLPYPSFFYSLKQMENTLALGFF